MLYTNTAAIEALQSQIEGAVLTAAFPDYDQARLAWNLNINHHPAIIVVAKHAADVVAAVRFARAEGLQIAVQGTGHGAIRPADDALLIITSQMKGLHIDVATQTAWVEAGLKWGDVLEKAQQVGLAPLLGSTTDVGVVGYTLGGGMGWLARKYGLSADNVVYFEIVTADGRLVRASADRNPDLFWALRGGGGGFGIVTGMQIKLFPVTMVYGGNLFYPIEMAQDVITHYREWIQNAPEELTSSFLIMNFPNVPFVPEFLRGQSFVMVRGVYSGTVEHGEALLKFWREWRVPLIDAFRPMPFTEVDTVSSDPLEPTHAYATSAWLRELSDEAIDTLIRFGAAENGSPLLIAEVRHAAGAIAKVAPQSAAYSNRDAAHILEMISSAPTPELLALLREYTDEIKRQLQPVMTGVYMNFIHGEEADERVKDTFTPEKFQRLQAIKAMYDPQNVFSFGFNIQPAK